MLFLSPGLLGRHTSPTQRIVQEHGRIPAGALNALRAIWMIRSDEIIWSQASDFIERAIYAYESGWHASWSWTTDTSRLPYSINENR